jgi:hypothetical protein
VKYLKGAPLLSNLLASPTNIRPAMGKHSSLLQTFVNYGHESFITLDPGVDLYKIKSINVLRKNLFLVQLNVNILSGANVIKLFTAVSFEFS